MAPEVSQVDIKVMRNILRRNPWYVGSQFEWAAKPSISRIYEKRYEFIKGCVERAKSKSRSIVKILDAGCGDGYWLWRLHNIEDIELMGVDYNPVRIERARSVVPGINVVQSDLMTFESEELFDVVLLNHVIEHVEDDKLLLSRMCRSLKEDGTLVLGTPNEGSFLLQERNKRTGNAEQSDHVHFYTEEEITRKLRESGFHIERVMREVFYIGDDSNYYNLLETDFGFDLLQLLTAMVPSGCSGFYFECNPANQYQAEHQTADDPCHVEMEEILCLMKRLRTRYK